MALHMNLWDVSGSPGPPSATHLILFSVERIPAGNLSLGSDTENLLLVYASHMVSLAHNRQCGSRGLASALVSAPRPTRSQKPETNSSQLGLRSTFSDRCRVCYSRLALHVYVELLIITCWT
jgi:hypothetical protein